MLINLYSTNWLFKQCCYITHDVSTAKFIQSEVTMNILECNDDRYVKLFTNDEHKAYLTKVIYIEYINKYSNTNKYFNKKNEIHDLTLIDKPTDYQLSTEQIITYDKIVNNIDRYIENGYKFNK